MNEPIAPVSVTPPISVEDSVRARAHLQERSSRWWASWGITFAGFSIGLLALTITVIVALSAAAALVWLSDTDDVYASCTGDSIAVIPISGSITSDQIGIDADGYAYTSSIFVTDAIDAAINNEDIVGIVFDINSPGGEVVPSMEIADAIERVSEVKPTASYIRSMGDSGAYLAAIAARRVFAHELADVGSIGVILSYLDEVDKNKQEGYRYIEFKSAPLKSAGSPYRDLSEEERLMFQGQVDDIHGKIIDHVARLRGLPRARVEELANGSTWIGFRAVEEGIVDEVGTIQSALDYVASSSETEEYAVCKIPNEAESLYSL